MTNDEQHDIPELHDRLSGRLSSPNPESIRGEAARRSETKRQTLLGVGAAAVVVIIAVAGIFALNGDDTTETATADTTEAASQLTEDVGLSAAGAIADDSAPFEVEPVPVPGTIPPTIDTGLVVVKDFSNFEKDQAISLVEEDGFVVEVQFLPVDPSRPEGRVIDQFPKPGAIGEPGSVIRIIVGELDPELAGTDLPANAVVPDIAGLEFNQALNELFELDFRTSRIDEPSADVPAGTVIRTEPAPGDELLEGSFVTIFVSSGPGPVTVPNVETLLAGPAQQALVADGFEVVINAAPTDNTAEINRVVSQTPPANVEVEAGSIVTITIGVLPADVSPSDLAVLVTEANVDGAPGNESIWLASDGTLHAGDLSATADFWEIEQSYFDELASLTTATFDDDTTAIILAMPVPDEPEDPPNVFQVFLVSDGQLDRVFNSTIGAQQVTPTFPGNGTVTYIEDGWTACLFSGEDTAAIHEITLSLQGRLVQTSRQDTGDVQDCNQLAG